MTEFAALLAAFREATGREAALWESGAAAEPAHLLGASSDAFALRSRSATDGDVDVAEWCSANDMQARHISDRSGEAWLILDDAQQASDGQSDELLVQLFPVVHRLIRERDGATHELADRYEEINLLYAIGELLGGTASVESVAETLLQELAATVGATRAVFLLTHRSSDSVGKLVPIASIGLRDLDYPEIALDNDSHIAVCAFRLSNACTAEGLAARRGDPVISANDEALLAVAITRPSSGAGITGQFQAVARLGQPLPVSHSSVPPGVIVLGARKETDFFTAGDRKLALAVSTQVGVALQNAALVRSAMERQQLVRELRLAHDLQLKLLPDTRVVGPEARAAARVVPAESVGGDFYLLVRLDSDRTAVLIGDVSGHGYQAALVMALSLSAAAIHVQAAFDPAIALESVRRSLAEELTSTDMSLSLCYALIDARLGELRYANAGHPHAFRLGADGDCLRLSASVPPLGFSDTAIADDVIPWRRGDRVVLFTDGLVDARDAKDGTLGEQAVLGALGKIAAASTPEEILGSLLSLAETHAGGTPLRDDLAIVVVDRPV